MKKLYLLITCLAILLSLNLNVYSQGKPYEGPEDGAGDPHLEREGFMNGNRCQLLFKNNTELGDYPRKDAARWPKGTGGNVMHDGIGLLVSSMVFLQNDTIPVADTTQIRLLGAQGLLDTLYYCQTNYREEMDRDPTGQIEWGFHPAPGYMNNASETPAISNDPNSWPRAGWPFMNQELHWPGEWDGRFGRGQIRADLECYIVANDAQDLEYLGEDDTVKYYPRPGVKIGDFHPGVTVQRGQPWGGLGIRVKQRGFQWNNPMAQDCIFWEYTIANVSNYNLPNVAFGYWIDNDIGGENTGEDGSFDRVERLSYTWDTDGVGEDGYATGTQGFAFLESPGIFNDHIDNDFDGLVDEARDNPAGQKIGPYDGIQDLTRFLSFYALKESDLKPHWSGDEDQDWQDGEDLNKNGVYDADEFAGDDVGLDGVAPGEENYTGPDQDGTECNHQPDLLEGYAEPNFGWTDVSETDMLGLTTLLFYEAVPHVDPFTNWFRHDKSVWIRMTLTDSLESGATDINNLFELFASAIFPLYRGRTEFISLSELHSYDDLSGLMSAKHAAPALFTLKKTVQVIYEKDYRFAQPPSMPKLTAIPGDGYVLLTWDNRSDTKTREPFLNNINDFEGYKLYRATDKDLLDPRIITDGFGTKTLMKPIFQCDLRNDKKGFTDYGLLNGMGYYLGEDSGIAYSFKDENVQNGRTYYYALVAYDYGITPGQLKGVSAVAQDSKYGIAPSENNPVITKDEAEEVVFISSNVQIVTPGTEAAGVETEPEQKLDVSHLLGSGTVIPEIVDRQNYKAGHQYKIKFEISRIDSASYYHRGHGIFYSTGGLRVYDVTNNQNKPVFEDILMASDLGIKVPKILNTVMVRYDNNTASGADDFYHISSTELVATEIFDGIRLNIKLDYRTPVFDSLHSGWMPGKSPMTIAYNQDIEYYPWDYNIVFSDHAIYTSKLSVTSGVQDEFGTRLPRTQILRYQEFNFKVENLSIPDSLGQPDVLEMLVYDVNGNNVFDLLEDRIIVGQLNNRDRWDATLFLIDFQLCRDENDLPANNDVYAIRFKRPFWYSDSLLFSLNPKITINEEKLKKTMDAIRVVPNPYVASNVMESSVINKYLNQRRRLLFTNLPMACTIKIFTVSGILIRELHLPEDGLVKYSATNKYTHETSDLGIYSDGILHWDMLTSEGLEIAAGMYLYHVQDDQTGEERMGKFGVIK